MYRKKDNRAMIIAAIVVILVIAAFYLIPGIMDGTLLRQVEAEDTEPVRYEVLIRKPDAGQITVGKAWLKSDTAQEARLAVEPGTLVSLTVTAYPGRVLEGVQAVEVKDYMNELQTVISETGKDTTTIDFSMPAADVIVNFRFRTEMTEAPEQVETEIWHEETERQTEETEKQTEETEPESPYGLMLHGITPELIRSFGGHFDDREFCRQLGDAIRPDLAGSEYYGVTDVTFSDVPYEGETETDKVYTYIYFNENPDWSMLATYYLKDGTYIFTRRKAAEAETEMETEKGTVQEVSYGGDGYGRTGYGSGSSSAASSSQTIIIPGTTITTTFDILQISRIFLDYTGGSEAFYSRAFDYVLESGLTGTIVGTMSSYTIDAEKGTAKIEIRLNNGQSFTADYAKESGSFEFSGL